MKFEIVLTDPFVVDSKSEVFKWWLDGVSKAAAVEKLLEGYLKTSQWPEIAKQHEGQLSDLFNNDTTDQYRMFDVLERYLKDPQLLQTQHICYLNRATQRVLIRNYYSLDQRSVLGLIKLYREQRGPSGKLQPLSLQRATHRAAAAAFGSAGNGLVPLDRQLHNIHRVYGMLLLQDNGNSGSGGSHGHGHVHAPGDAFHSLSVKLDTAQGPISLAAFARLLRNEGGIMRGVVRAKGILWVTAKRPTAAAAADASSNGSPAASSAAASSAASSSSLSSSSLLLSGWRVVVQMSGRTPGRWTWELDGRWSGPPHSEIVFIGSRDVLNLERLRAAVAKLPWSAVTATAVAAAAGSAAVDAADDDRDVAATSALVPAMNGARNGRRVVVASGNKQQQQQQHNSLSLIHI